ncbi:DUF2474 domain-containing protein [Amylibacter kogurei]|uniref:DUF2474 domain-containing protein n=1 Tax=Paramylibacter kogurei TaxID=1889778 RepID=A0A2G5K6P7_9RHOB|nr:DUF2474 family protein [Amylibacter kogurei]PIB25217.1 DUF2474 domain-containing protein [Amylibacter kogurei]
MAHKSWKQIAWFVALWLASVACLSVVAFVIKLFL